MSEIYENPVNLKAEDVNNYRPMLLDLSIRLSECESLYREATRANYDLIDKKNKFRKFYREIRTIMEWGHAYVAIERDIVSFEEINSICDTIVRHLTFIENEVVTATALNIYDRTIGAEIFEQEKTMRNRYQQIFDELINPAMKEHNEKYAIFNAFI